MVPTVKNKGEDYVNKYAQQLTVSESAPTDRAVFIRRTYAHLAAAILAFVGLEFYMVNSPIADIMLDLMSLRFGWLAILGGFILVGNLASRLAMSNASQTTQYIGLTLYVIAESVIFVPLLWLAVYKSSSDVLPMAGIMTLLLFGGLTLVAFVTRKDFSFLRSILMISGMLALGLIVCSVLFGFNLGLLFSFVMVLIASGAILYDTSNIIHHYHPDQYVAASLQLFASIALLFWYILRIFMSRD